MGQGIRSLVEEALEGFDFDEETSPDDEADARTDPSVWLWRAGPMWASSTLINAWLGEERLVAFDLPGTTRDAISRAASSETDSATS
jgi:GTP-binding protein